MTLSSFNACVPETFSPPTLFGAEILSINAHPVLDFPASLSLEARITQPNVDKASGLAFCNVTVTYTHPGTNNLITVETWLPDKPFWNERYIAAGGGGFSAGRTEYTYSVMSAAAQEGYTTSTTDAGVGTSTWSADDWALLSPGNVDLQKVRDFGTVSLNDQAIINKHIIENFYGKRPTYSYWNGCSQGGRQGLVLAQRYPKAYDGILAGAPGLRLPIIVSGIFAPQQLMNVLGEYPYACEFDAIRQAAVERCDEMDGVADGVVMDVEGCLGTFDPFELVGTAIDCPQADGQVNITLAAATVANSTWNDGIDALGRRAWYGVSPSTDLTGNLIQVPSTAMTNCSDGASCVGVPNPLGSAWVRLFMGKQLDFEYGNLSMNEYYTLVHESSVEFGSFFNTDDPDLSSFRDAGGKMLTYHGLDDNLISYKNTRDYYSDVTSLLPDVEGFYRYFEIPGFTHCSGGTGGEPLTMFEQLRAWVEKGVAPDDAPIGFTDAKGTEWNRVLCPFPQKAQYDSACGDATDADCWSCEG